MARIPGVETSSPVYDQLLTLAGLDALEPLMLHTHCSTWGAFMKPPVTRAVRYAVVPSIAMLGSAARLPLIEMTSGPTTSTLWLIFT